MEKEDKQLFKEFPGISTETWEEKILADLKGADYRKKLVWESDEGILVRPYYRSEDLESVDYLERFDIQKQGGAEANSWTICQDIFPGRDPKQANRRSNNALDNGAQAIRFGLGNAIVSGKDYIRGLVEGFPFVKAEILFQGFLGADVIYDTLLELAGKQGIDRNDIKGLLGADPLGKMTTTGVPVGGFENLEKLIRTSRESTPQMRVIDVDGAMFQNAGCSLVEELAFTLAMASEYLSLLTSRGISPDDVAGSMQLSMASGPNYFMEIAKLRAARILWSKVMGAYGGNVAMGIRIHATSSEWNMTCYDPHVNMLRGTTETMSSILGGADLISVLPYDHPYEEGNSFSDRIARNTQIILRDEAYFGRVADPASGSYYLENLTDEVAEKSWELFREIEARGGYKNALTAGWIQERVTASMQKKLDRASSGKGRILGTNAFPNFNESILAQWTRDKQETVTGSIIEPVRPFRIASVFEDVRLETERSGKPPSVFLFKYGNPVWVTARAAFSGNFFACAGYEILDQPASDTVGAGIEAARNSGASVVVLCSADDAYASLAPEVMDALREKAIVVVAGYPKDSIEVLKEAGIEHFIHMRSNLLQTLKQFNKLLL